jgi:gamma-glutamyltranspeptidase/glutathione hydrolase
MGNLFGTGRMAGDTGILLGASPAQKPQPLLSLTMLWNPNARAFHGMSGGSGQEGAPLAAASGLIAGLLGHLPASPPEPGRANVIACPLYLPDNSASCAWSTDPRGFGLAVGSN